MARGIEAGGVDAAEEKGATGRTATKILAAEVKVAATRETLTPNPHPRLATWTEDLAATIDDISCMSHAETFQIEPPERKRKSSGSSRLLLGMGIGCGIMGLLCCG